MYMKSDIQAVKASHQRDLHVSHKTPCVKGSYKRCTSALTEEKMRAKIFTIETTGRVITL
jgi:hypothetical protein